LIFTRSSAKSLIAPLWRHRRASWAESSHCIWSLTKESLQIRNPARITFVTCHPPPITLVTRHRPSENDSGIESPDRVHERAKRFYKGRSAPHSGRNETRRFGRIEEVSKRNICRRYRKGRWAPVGATATSVHACSALLAPMSQKCVFNAMQKFSGRWLKAPPRPANIDTASHKRPRAWSRSSYRRMCTRTTLRCARRYNQFSKSWSGRERRDREEKVVARAKAQRHRPRNSKELNGVEENERLVRLKMLPDRILGCEAVKTVRFYEQKTQWLLAAVCTKCRVFLRCCRDPNLVPRIRENYHRVPGIIENWVTTGPYQVPNIFLKNKPKWVKNALSRCTLQCSWHALLQVALQYYGRLNCSPTFESTDVERRSVAGSTTSQTLATNAEWQTSALLALLPRGKSWSLGLYDTGSCDTDFNY